MEKQDGTKGKTTVKKSAAKKSAAKKTAVKKAPILKTAAKEKDFAFVINTKPLTVGKKVVPGRKAFVRKDNGSVLALVSDKYHLVLHSDVVDKFETALGKMGAKYRTRKVMTDLPNDGAQMHRKYIFPKMTIDVGKKESFALVLELVNSYDGSTKIGYNCGAYDIGNNEEMIVSRQFQEIFRKHYESLDMGDIVTHLKDSIDAFSKIVGIWKKWHSEKITVKKAESLMEGLRISKKLRNSILSDFTEKKAKTKWDFFRLVSSIISTGPVQCKRKELHEVRKDEARQVLSKIFYTGPHAMAA